MKQISLFAVVAFALIIQSCSDNSTTTTPPTTSTNFLPLTVGSYFLYDRNTIDTMGVPVLPAVKDSAYVTQTLSFNGKSASQVITKTIATGVSDTAYYAKDSDGTLYRWLNFNNPALTQFAPTLVLPQAWVIFKNADGGSDTWKTYDSTLNNVAVTIPGFGTQNLNLKIVVNGNKSTDTTVTVSGKSYTAKRYISTARVGGYLVASPTTEAFYISIATTFSLIDGVGIYQSNTPNSNLMALTGAALAKVPGNRSTLTSFMLK